MYIADCVNNRVRKVTVSTGIITTIAGTGSASYSGDGGQATSASINYPGLVAFAGGNLYIPELNSHRIRKVTLSTGIIDTFAGTGTASYRGDGGVATSAGLYYPFGVTLDTSGNTLSTSILL